MFTSGIHTDLVQLQKDAEAPVIGNNFFSLHKTHNLTNGSTFEPVNAWMMAEFSRIAYVKDRARIVSNIKKVGFEVEFFYKDNTEAHVAWNDDYVVIFFRGTEPDQRKDIHSDIAFSKEDSETIGEVHHGFKDALDLVYSDIVKFYETKKEGRTLFITGHSLGGALATLCASRLRAGILYTFGSPRVGGRHFAKYMDSDFNDITYYRFVNNADIVPHVPPAFIGFRHCGTLHQINKEGKFFGNPSLSMNFASNLKAIGLMHLGSIMNWLSRTILRRTVASRAADHSMINYSNGIKSNLGE